ncbi:MAG TPA: hypothetical protein VJ698_24060 [Noviherbaspirillum sp.]|uniref:hypothetical protein n=1 Tax=Noviherbaspirillum sp. TaxID=1926288 RepID=UPI002B45D50E|nr:hypothetical protein [Noviherbaspirillum sp.]HJV88561.1 hypothetical protein [Noviherbaspirillum sp.]
MRKNLAHCAATLCFTACLAPVAMANGTPQPPATPLHPPHEAKYSFRTIDVPDALGTAAYGINDAGAIVGRFFHPQLPGQFSINHGFLLENGQFTTIQYPPAPGDDPDIAETAYDINNKGVIAGGYRVGHGFNYAFLLEGGTYTTLAQPEPYIYVSSANGITDAGTIIGTYISTRISDIHSFMLKQGNFTTIDVPGSISTYAYGINHAEEVVGEYISSNTQHHGYLSSGGGITNIDRPGADSTTPYGINRRGQIAGTYLEAGVMHGFVLAKGNYLTIDYPGATNTEVFGINSKGVVVGDYLDADGHRHGFVATPRHHAKGYEDGGGSMLMSPF